jgi:hypothetical protein
VIRSRFVLGLGLRLKFYTARFYISGTSRVRVIARDRV